MINRPPSRLFFNGCSFVHGLDVAWDYNKNPRLTEESRILGSNYWHDLQKVNLSGRVHALMGSTEVVNKARNGNNNDVIAYDTIAFFKAMMDSGGDPTEWMAFIGWTEPARIMIFDELDSHAAMTFNPFNINDLIKQTSMYDNDRMQYLHEFYERHREFSKAFVTCATPTWLANQLLRSVLTVQFFLDSIGVKYVFWNSLHPMPRPNGAYLPRMIYSTTDQSHWLPVWSTTDHPIFTGWLPMIKKSMMTRTNHPTKEAVDIFADQLVGFVQKSHGLAIDTVT